MCDITRGEFEELRDRVNVLITDYNMTTAYLENQSNVLAHHVQMPWYRFIIWLWPLPYPRFQRKLIVNKWRVRPDRIPVLRQVEK